VLYKQAVYDIAKACKDLGLILEDYPVFIVSPKAFDAIVPNVPGEIVESEIYKVTNSNPKEAVRYKEFRCTGLCDGIRILVNTVEYHEYLNKLVDDDWQVQYGFNQENFSE
jgi:hypothetical protein